MRFRAAALAVVLALALSACGSEAVRLVDVSAGLPSSHEDIKRQPSRPNDSTRSASAEYTAIPGEISVIIPPGGSLSVIGAAFGVSVQRLYEANPEIVYPWLIYPGQKIRIPDPGQLLPRRPFPSLAPARSAVYRSSANAAIGDVWADLRNCESGGDYTANTGNGYYGAYQFTESTWDSMHTGYERADLAPSYVQDDAARRLQQRSGWGQWPACSRRIGVR
jgi:LysM repeat protein